MDTTTNLGLPYIMAAQAQKHVTHNEALRALDAVVQLAVLDRTLTAPPVATADGDRYIVAAVATGDWSGKDGKIAAWQDGAWAFLTPKPGWIAWIEDESQVAVFDGGNWIAVSGGGGGSVNPTPLVGVNTTADPTNRLAVKSDAVLLSHDDVTPGSGDLQLKINKQSASNTAAMVFQTGFSGRAEFGLTGDDNWHVKVSPDGSIWFDCLVADRNSGSATFANGVEASGKFLCLNPSTGQYPAQTTLPIGMSISEGITTFGYPGFGGVLTVNITANRCFQWFVDGATGAFYFRFNHVSQPSGQSNWSSWKKIWSEVTQGSGSGLIADKATSYTVTGLPSASSRGQGAIVYVSNESGGGVLAFSDGTNWRRVTDRAIVS